MTALSNPSLRLALWNMCISYVFAVRNLNKV
jgi:hypothetical protein